MNIHDSPVRLKYFTLHAQRRARGNDALQLSVENGAVSHCQ